MKNSRLFKRLSLWKQRFHLYPQPEPLPHTRFFWLATGIVTMFVVLFSTYFIIYLTTRHDALLTNAEDLGIMDQAIWNTIQGHLFHQTICNIVNDTNCYSLNGISRFAIHFEPILFPVSLLFLIWPTPKTLLILQTLVVASGAYPAFWLACLRLRNEWVAIAFAVLYLLYPAQLFATVNDFHAVTFTSAFLLFTFYFMYTRRTIWLFVFAVLSMACKEEIPVVIALYGLWSICFQQNWRTGLSLIVSALAWVGLGLLIIHFFSPTGQSLLSSRYAYLGNGPVAILRNIVLHPITMLKNNVFEHNHFAYLRSLLAPAGYLPLLAPWVLILAAPTLALNLLSSDINMYSGMYQYNAEIVPVLIFSTIEAVVLIIWLWKLILKWILTRRMQTIGNRSAVLISPRLDNLSQSALLVALIGIILFSTLRADTLRSGLSLPFTQDFQWPQTSQHTEMLQNIVDLIPTTASLSAQSGLVPHVSHRQQIYLFPNAINYADYILLDVTSDIYPFDNSQSYVHTVKSVLFSGDYGVVAARDGYLLLERGLPAPGVSPNSTLQANGNIDNQLPDLPDEFCSFESVSKQEVVNSVDVAFSQADGTDTELLKLVGYQVKVGSTFSLSSSYMRVTTYWQVGDQAIPPLQLLVLVTDQNGTEHFASVDFPELAWCPTNIWQAGTIHRLTSRIFAIEGQDIPTGIAHVSIALLPLAHPFSTIMDEQDRLPLHIVSVKGALSSSLGTNALQLATIKIIP